MLLKSPNAWWVVFITFGSVVVVGALAWASVAWRYGTSVFDTSDRLISFAQFLLAVGAVSLAVQGGWYVVTQVKLASQNIDLARQALDLARETLNQTKLTAEAEQSALRRQTLQPLINELKSNWAAALSAEGRIKIDLSMGSPIPHFPYSMAVYDALVAGPLWRLSPQAEVTTAVVMAYQLTRRLTVSWPRWALNAGFAGLLGLIAPSKWDLWKKFLTGVVAGARLVVFGLVLQWGGRATAARLAIERRWNWLRASYTARSLTGRQKSSCYVKKASRFCLSSRSQTGESP
ncbi:MAG: hypothetical protein ACRDHX_09925 [Chloroflexota bacterium]